MIALHDLRVLPDLLRLAECAYGEEPAIQLSGRPESTRTYRSVNDLASRGGALLAGMPADPGDAVIMLLDSGPDWVVTFFSIQVAGLVAVPLLMNTPPDRLPAIAQRVGARFAVTGGRAKGSFSMQPGFVEIAVDSLLNHSNRLVRPRTRFPDDLALLAFTSGTTAQSKIVELSHGNLISDVRSVLEVGTAGLGDSLLSMLPLAHLFELTGGLLSPLACGARIVYEPSPLPNRIIGALHDQGITHALAVPGLVKCLVEEVCSQRKALNGSPDIPGPMASVRRVIGPSFHTLIVGGASLEADLIKTLRCADIQVGVGYGLTEAGPIVSLGLLDSIPVGSVGRPLPGVEVRLSEAGEILVRGGNVMRGYHRDPEASRSVFVDGWLRTGDLGTIDENGCLYLTGRLKELIITSTGETLDPAEMEVYYNHPKFAEIAVVGLRAADGNDEPVLFAVPSNKETADEVCQDVFTKLRTAAPARFRASRLIRLHQPLPRTATGKVRRVDLRTKGGALMGRAERK